jgi:hypothetical protein
MRIRSAMVTDDELCRHGIDLAEHCYQCAERELRAKVGPALIPENSALAHPDPEVGSG